MSFSRIRWRGGAFLILLALALALGVIRRFSSEQANPLLADQVAQDEDSVPVLPQRHELADQPKAEAPTEARISTPGATSFLSWAPRTNPDAHFRIIGPEGGVIAGARVLYVDSGKRGALAVPEFEWLAERHSLALVQDKLETCSSDAAGQFVIKAPGDSVSLWIDALGYDCREARFFSSDDFRHGLSTIQLGREKSIQVQLRSASGQVLKDIPVGLFRRSRVDLPEMTRISSGLSNAQGLVRLAAPLEEEPLPDCDYLAALMFPEWPLTNVFLDPNVAKRFRGSTRQGAPDAVTRSRSQPERS